MQCATPAKWSGDAKQLTCTVDPNTDYWRITHYGFIRDSKTQQNVFFHINALTYQAKENDKVTFTVEKGPKGLNAVGVKKL